MVSSFINQLVLMFIATVASNATMFYTKNISVKSNEALSAILQWQLNSSQTVSDGVCHEIHCFAVRNNIAMSIGNWSLTSVEINADIKAIYGGRLTLSCTNKAVTLTISNAVYADSGIYRCGYKNKTIDVNLAVVGKPRLEKRNFSDQLIVNEKTPLFVEVTYCGNPRPEVEWEFLKQKVVSSYQRANQSTNISGSSSQKSFCYKYIYTAPKLSRHTCPSTLRYTVTGLGTKTTFTSKITLTYLPNKLKNVITKRKDDCLLTHWDAPSQGPMTCKSRIDYDVHVEMKDKSSQTFSSSTSTFLLCNNTILVNNVQEITVRARNVFGNGSYITSKMAANTTIVPAVSVVVEEKSFQTAFIIAVAILSILLLVGLMFCSLFLFRRYCQGDDETDSKARDTEIATVDDTPRTLQRQKKEKFNTLRKQDIVHKPRPMSHVVTRPVSKSNTFHGRGYVNRHTTDAQTLQRAFMPLNTLQKRISDHLRAYSELDIPSTQHTMPSLYSHVLENKNADDNRYSGATDSTSCTPEESRRFEAKQALSRMDSYDSVQSEYDTPARRGPSMKKAASNYDLPRCQTLPNETSDLATKRALSMYDLPHCAIIPFPEINTRNNIKNNNRNAQVLYGNTRKVSEESETSDYSTPRNTIFEDEDENEAEIYTPHEYELSKENKERFESAYARPIDIIPIADVETFTKPKTKGFEVPCSSRVDGLYDTPKAYQLRRENVKQNRSKSLDANISENNHFENYDELPRRATIATPENLYDNIKNVLADRGIKRDTVIYEELPNGKAIKTDNMHYTEGSLADVSTT